MSWECINCNKINKDKLSKKQQKIEDAIDKNMKDMGMKMLPHIDKYCELPEDQISNKINSAFTELKQKFIELKPEKLVFEENFKKIEYKNKPIARERIRYILTRIDESKTSGEYKIDFANVNIEHILPKKPTKWNLTKKEIKPYVDKLGNLSLLSSEINGDIGNGILDVFDRYNFIVSK